MIAATQTGTEQRWVVEVFVSLKPAVNDPQGLAIRDGLHMLGYDEVQEVRAGKYMQLEILAGDRATAEQRITDMCEKLLANTVIETYRFDIQPMSGQNT